MFTLRVVGGILLILLLKKLFHRGTDDASANRDNDAASSSSATQDCDSSDSTSSCSGHEYEVFLSFRGEDTRNNFTDHLYPALHGKGIHTFRDDEKLLKGEKIAEELKSAIHGSKIAIVIFSKGYAYSKWCLRELAEISKCRKKETGQRQMIVFPVFYQVDPSEVRNQTGSYGTAFQHHEKKIDEETVLEWRKALRDVGELKGWDLKNTADGHQAKLVSLVVEEVFRRIKSPSTVPDIKSPSTIQSIPDIIVGMSSHVEEIEKLMSMKPNQIVGIHGLGGIGKTTIAQCVYNKVYRDFEGYCFLMDVRETFNSMGIIYLQSQLVMDLLNQKRPDICSIDEGIAMIKQRLSTKKVLIVLDDVDRYIHLDALIGHGDWFGSGSKIIITTRDEHVLSNLGVDNIYKPKWMNEDQSLILFSRYAFKTDNLPEDYLELSREVVKTTGGLPLALKVVGSYFFLKKKSEWINALKTLANRPLREVQEKLIISYEGLDHEERQMFLDIACFFIGMKKDIACYIWDGSDFSPHLGIEILRQKSFIEIDERNIVRMHDQLRDLGREIVCQENPVLIGERSRLWSRQEVMEILKTQQGTNKVEGVCLSQTWEEWRDGQHTIIEGFGTMNELRILKVDDANVAGNLVHPFPRLSYLSWHSCPIHFVPTHLKRLSVLDLSRSDITDEWMGWQYIKEAGSLMVLKLSCCRQLSQTPDLSANTQLEELHVDGCLNLNRIDESVGHLKNLVTLDIKYCRYLRFLPDSICELSSLETLDLRWSGIRQLPERWVHLEASAEQHTEFSKIRLRHLPNLEILTTG